jgi:hypothetical protein
MSKFTAAEVLKESQEQGRRGRTANAEMLRAFAERMAEQERGEPMLQATLTVLPNSQEWANVDGAVAWHLIERHCETWADIRLQMDEWRKANPLNAYRSGQLVEVTGEGETPRTPDANKVICPKCVHQFVAIPENVQAELAAMRGEYICKCGLRVTPHRCQTGSDF